MLRCQSVRYMMPRDVRGVVGTQPVVVVDLVSQLTRPLTITLRYSLLHNVGKGKALAFSRGIAHAVQVIPNASLCPSVRFIQLILKWLMAAGERSG